MPLSIVRFAISYRPQKELEILILSLKKRSDTQIGLVAILSIVQSKGTPPSLVRQFVDRTQRTKAGSLSLDG